MAKYTMDVNFDIPQEVLKEIPQDNPTSVVTSELFLDRLDRATTPDEYSSVRVSLQGSDSWCQKQARKLSLTVKTANGPRLFKSRGFEIVHCQG